MQESAHFIKAHLQTGAMILDESIDNDISDIIVNQKIPYLKIEELHYLRDPEKIKKILFKRKI